MLDALKSPVSPIKPKVRTGPAFEPDLLRSPFRKLPEPELVFPMPFFREPKAIPSPLLLARIFASVPPPSKAELAPLREAETKFRELSDESLKWSDDAAVKEFGKQNAAVEAALAAGKPLPACPPVETIRVDYARKVEAIHELRNKVLTENRERAIPLLQRYVEGARKLIPKLQEEGAATAKQWGIPDPSIAWILAIREFPCWLTTQCYPLTSVSSMPFLRELLARSE
jgi:hypothetical protein